MLELPSLLLLTAAYGGLARAQQAPVVPRDYRAPLVGEYGDVMASTHRIAVEDTLLGTDAHVHLLLVRNQADPASPTSIHMESADGRYQLQGPARLLGSPMGSVQTLASALPIGALSGSAALHARLPDDARDPRVELMALLSDGRMTDLSMTLSYTWQRGPHVLQAAMPVLRA